MSAILMLYGSTDGHTKKIAGVLANTLRGLACEVTVVDAAAASAIRPGNYDAVIVAASLHAAGYQRAVRRWVRAHAAELSRRPGAFVSVCLGILERRPIVDHNLREIIRRFENENNWHPEAVKMVAGALPYTRYGWLKKRIMKRIAAKTGGGTDTTRDYEYTDWDDLRSFAHEFAANVQGVAKSPVADVGLGHYVQASHVACR